MTQDRLDEWLAQEREVLAIEMLLKAGNAPQARARAQRFETANPDTRVVRMRPGLIFKREAGPSVGQHGSRAGDAVGDVDDREEGHAGEDFGCR